MSKRLSNEWKRRITEMPTQADIDRCVELWPDDWQAKNAFYAGQVATLLADNARLRAELADAQALTADAEERLHAIAEESRSLNKRWYLAARQAEAAMTIVRAVADGRVNKGLALDSISVRVSGDYLVDQARALLASVDTTAADNGGKE